MNFLLLPLPPANDLETRAVLKKTASAHRYLAELKGVSASIPNQEILINTLALQEARDSSAVENIITTNDDLFKNELFPEYPHSPGTKEVRDYATALKTGFGMVNQHQLLTENHIIAIQSLLEKSMAGYRRLPGTVLRHSQSGAVIYTPPQHEDEIIRLMNNLEQFINDDSLSDADPLVKMALIHYQFESIHPFYDGNGRTGRIINVLYLVLKGLLDIPVLYLSRYIVRNKAGYYARLQAVRDTGDWESWLLFMLEAVEETSRQTITMVRAIGAAVDDYKQRIRSRHRFYSHELINNLFFHPYTKIEFIERDLGVTRLTAAKYLDALSAPDEGFLRKEKIGRANYYINTALFRILAQ